MAICKLNHVNIRTEDVAGTVQFYCDVLGMKHGATPTDDAQRNAWLLDEAGNPIIHIGDVTLPYPTDPIWPSTGATDSGPLHHVALDCTDYDAMRARLAAQGADYAENDIPHFGIRQIFLRDPNNIMLELNFSEG